MRRKRVGLAAAGAAGLLAALAPSLFAQRTLPARTRLHCIDPTRPEVLTVAPGDAREAACSRRACCPCPPPPV